MKLEARVEKGRLVCDPVVWSIAMREFEGRVVAVEIDRKRARRSTAANARHWAVIVPLAQHALNLKRGPELIPLSKDQTHYVLVTAFGASEETELGPWLADLGYGIPDGPDAGVQVEEATA